jgi:hypothetical protein
MAFLVCSFLLLQPPAAKAVAAPELVRVSGWLNSTGVRIADQKGKVVIVHFFAFG